MDQLQEWGRYLGLEPLGFAVEDARHSVLIATIHRALGSKTAKPSDFSMADKSPATDPASDGKTFVEHVKKALGAVKPRPVLPRRRRGKKTKQSPQPEGE